MIGRTIVLTTHAGVNRMLSETGTEEASITSLIAAARSIRS
ncbi:hypothetical protein [Methanofollis fontis]|nr:hypothetical protein [Methanofollis fontis]